MVKLVTPTMLIFPNHFVVSFQVRMLQRNLAWIKQILALLLDRLKLRLKVTELLPVFDASEIILWQKHLHV
jgi:hypothetical protein